MPLAFLPDDCAGCGACCYLMVELTEEDAKRLAPSMYERVEVKGKQERRMRRAGDGRCINLDSDTNLCSIYEDRPQVCRDFERGNGNCHKALYRLERAEAGHATTDRFVPMEV